MNTFKRFFPYFISVMILGLAATSANAQATRTWVSGVGDDANPCSRTAPCKTFAGAISKTADGGEINAIDPGGFGTVTITKSITIDGEAVLAGVLASGNNAFLINAPGEVVTLRNLDINGNNNSPNGVRILAAKEVNIENCVIYNFTQAGVSDERINGGLLSIDHTVIRDNANAGVSLTGTGSPIIRATLTNVQLKNDYVGISINNNNAATISKSLMFGNANAGAFVTGGTSELTVEDTMVTGNYVGLRVYPTGTPVIRISAANVTKNDYGLIRDAGQIISYGNNRIGGNLLSDGAATQNAMLQ